MLHGVLLAASFAGTYSLTHQPSAGRPLPPLAVKFDEAFPEKWFEGGAKSDELVHAAMLGDAGWIEQAVAQRGGRVVTKTKSVVTALLPSRAMLELAGDARVKRVQLGRLPSPASPPADAQAVTPRAAKTSDVPLAQRPFAVENMGFDKLEVATRPTGAGVVLACIEGGGLPDFRHPDFRHADGRTRFAAIWDQQNGPSIAEGGASFGTLYTQAKIDALLKDGTGKLAFAGASEHVTESFSVAAGNGAAAGKYRGVAPEATLVGVMDTVDGPGLIEAVDFVFKQADGLGMPCVASISETITLGRGLPDDGRDPTAVALSELVKASNGRAIVSSAGNNAHILRHVKVALTGYGPVRTARYWAMPTSMPGDRPINSLAFANDTKLRVRVHYARLDEHKAVSIRASSPWIGLADALKAGPVEYDLTEKHQTAQGQETISGRMLAVVPHYGDSSHSWLTLGFVKPSAPAAKGKSRYIVEFDGEGVADAWSSLGMLMDDLSDEDSPARPRDYVTPDCFYSIDSPANALDVIAVGSYVNNDVFEGGKPVAMSAAAKENSAPGAVMSYSQPGGSVEGDWQPLLLVGAHGVPAAIPLDAPTEGEDRLPGGLYALFGGTSCASPVLAGTCALYLQKHPHATLDELRAVLQRACFEDGATGPTPNPKSGHGKLNAQKLLVDAGKQ